MMNGQSMQAINDPDRFRYVDLNNGIGPFQPGKEVLEDPDESGFNFNQTDSPARKSQAVMRKEMNQSPTKTAGQIQLKDLAPEDVTNEPYNGRDAVVVIEGEMRQFDGKRQDKIQRYVESLVTGNFMEVKKEINLQIQQADINDKTKKLQSSREFLEREMREIQKVWVNRTNKLFYMFLGLLAGMSLMHLIVLLSQSNKTLFLQLYQLISITVNAVFMIFTSFCLVLGLALTLIYKQKSDEKMRNLDEFRLEFRQHYIVSTIITSFVAVCLVIIYILPMYTNKFYYW